MKKICVYILLGIYLFDNLYVFSSTSLTDQYLYFEDRNNNAKIDTLELEFNTVLSGSLNIDKLFLYSASGGLSSTKLDSISGIEIFSGYTLSGNILTLYLHEQDTVGTGLIINNTTSSYLRLKTNVGVGIKDEFGNEMKLLYTTSFNSYKNIAYKEFRDIPITPIENTSGSGTVSSPEDISPIENQIDTGSLISSGSIFESGTLSESGGQNIFTLSGELTQTGAFTSSGLEKSNISTGGNQPTQIISFSGKIIFQNPTYFTDKTENISEYHCSSSETDCRVNYNLQIDTGSGFSTISTSKYNCEWDFGFGEFLEEKYKCNPNTITYPEGTFQTSYKIYEVARPENSFEKVIKIVNNGYISLPPVRKTVYTTIETKEENIVIGEPKIDVQSGIDEYGNCSKEACSINLNYDENNSKELCLWNFSGGIYTIEDKDKCNPSYVKYPLGDYEITLKVYEKGNQSNFRETKLFIHNKKQINPEKDITIKSSETFSGTSQPLSFFDYSGLKIMKVFPNPSGKDDEEFIEIQNTSTAEMNLKGCFLDDKIKSGSKPFLIERDDMFLPGESKKYYKSAMHINLDNTAGDEVNLLCQEKIIDTFSWGFGVGDDVILTLDNKSFTGEKLEISNSLLRDQVFIQEDNLGILNEEKMQIMNKNFTQKIKKQKKGVKIYGTTFPNTKVILEIIKIQELSFFPIAIADNGFFEVYSDTKGKYEILLPDVEVGDFQVKNYLTIDEKNIFPLQTISTFDVDNDYLDYIHFDAKKTKNLSGNQKQLDAHITLQKTAKGIGIQGNKIFCNEMKECSINFDGRASEGNIKQYFWDFGNGIVSQKANPSSVKFASGKYVVSLKVTDGFDEKENFFLVSVIPKAKAATKEPSVEKKKDTKTLGKTTKVDIVPESKIRLDTSKNMQKDMILSIIIGVLFLIGGAIILRREQII